MVGNPVPPSLAFVLAEKIYADLSKLGFNSVEFSIKNHKVERLKS